MGDITRIEYICANNPEGVNAVLEMFGYTPVFDNYNAQINLVEKMIYEQPQVALEALMSQHPDYGLIVETYQNTDEYAEATKPKKEAEKETVKEAVQDNSHQMMSNDYISRSNFNNTLKDVVLVVMAFWLIREIVKRD